MKRKLVLLAFVSVLLLSAVPAGDPHQVTSSLRVQSGVDWWPMFHHDPRHTGYSNSTAPNNNNTAWVYHIGATVHSSPAVANGKVFVGSYDGNLYALDASTGTKIWNTTVGDYVPSSPAVADGKVFIAGLYFTDGFPWMIYNISALDELTGTIIWTNITMRAYSTGVNVDSTVADGKVFVGAGNGVYALNETTGAMIWSYPTAGQCRSSPAFADGKVFVGVCGHNFSYALNASTGAQIWNCTTGEVSSSPAVVDGKVFVGSYNGNLYALNETTGTKIWNHTVVGFSCFGFSPAVADGKVFTGSYAFNATTGTLLWNFPYTDGYPAIADGKVFAINSTPGLIYAINETTGTEIWSYKMGDRVFCYPSVAGGKVFVGSNDGNVYCFGPSPVGGIYIPVNKLELLAPYIGLTIMLAVAVTKVAYVKKRKVYRDYLLNNNQRTS